MIVDPAQPTQQPGRQLGWLSKLRSAARVPLGLLDRNDTVRNRAVVAWAKTIPAGSLILDIGAGSCKYAPYFNHCQYTPQDTPGVNYAPPGLTVLRSDLTSIPLKDGSVDAILCTEVLEHVERPLDAIAEFGRLLKPSGRLLLSVPAACRVHRVPTHYYGGFAPDFFERSLPARGFALEKLEAVGNWSQFMAQEVGRLPSVIRDHTRLPGKLTSVISIALWPTFRIAIPVLLLAFSRFDASDDLQLGWIAYAAKS